MPIHSTINNSKYIRKEKYTVPVLGLTNYMPGNRYYRLLYGEVDNIKSLTLKHKAKLDNIIGIDKQLTLWKSNKGFHYISLNLYTLKEWKKIIAKLFIEGLICQKFLAFTLWWNRSTLRITKKHSFEQCSFIYNRIGDLNDNKISLPHLRIFSYFLTNEWNKLIPLREHGYNKHNIINDGYQLHNYFVPKTRVEKFLKMGEEHKIKMPVTETELGNVINGINQRLL